MSLEQQASPKAAAPPAAGADKPKRSLMRGLFGWVLVPGTLASALVALGVHVGANQPEMWFSRLVAWLTLPS